MMRKLNWKRIALAGLLLVLLLGISGCFTKPDKVEVLPTDPVQVLPFETATPVPSPTATDQSGWEGWTPTDPSAVVTQQAPVTTPTIGLITASPTPPPVVTYTPAPTATPTQDTTLRNGSSGQTVRNLQQRLKDLGYYTGSVDGDFGGGTESALREFQRVNGLTVDGIAGTRTQAALNSSSAKSKPKATQSGAYATSRPAMKEYTPSTPSTYRYLQNGSSGSDVTKLQNRLKELGYFKSTVSGKFGVDTEAAVLAFQERNGLWVDGVAGEDTQRMLYSTAALPAASGGSSTVPSTGYRTLKSGLTGEDVSLLQERLTELGYYTGTADGSYGTSTGQAVSDFQQTNGLTVDGVAGGTTQARIYSPNALYAPVDTVALSAQLAVTETLEKGSMGEEVYRLQERLYDLGYYTDRIDGVYTDAVATAVRAFQRANGISSDGKAGKSTLKKLYSDDAVPAKTGANDTYSALKQGDQGERVRALQGLLNTYGYFHDNIDGTFGASTTASVTAFQIQNGMSPDGIAGAATQQLLYEGSPIYAPANLPASAVAENTPATTYETLKLGSSGADVVMMQQFLSEIGYYADDEAGTFGASTMLAVQDFQERNGLTPDGVAGGETLALIFTGRGEPSASFGVAQVYTPERSSVKQGDEGQDVFTMQERLFVLGYFTDILDGKFGASTTAAVKAFQTANGLSADGVAGEMTIAAMYAAGAVPQGGIAQRKENFTVVSNRDRELEEQRASGAIQASLSGGGVAASYSSTLYYTGTGGKLHMVSGDSDKQIYNGEASYIHASEKGVTFVSDNKIVRVPARGGSAEVLVKSGGLKKLSVVGDTLYYQDGNSLVRAGSKGDPQVLSTDVTDFAIDIYQYLAYTASSTGIRSIGLNGSGEELVVSTSADQVQLADNVIFFRSGGDIYRIEDGISVKLLEANATWMAVYREKIYYISGYGLYCCDTDGTNAEIMYNGAVGDVSFVSGKAYITEKKGGPVTQILETGE